MTLQEQLDKQQAALSTNFPEQAAIIDTDTDNLVKMGIGNNGPKVGDQAPDFELPDQLNRSVRSVDLRANGPLVISFYRGNW